MTDSRLCAERTTRLLYTYTSVSHPRYPTRHLAISHIQLLHACNRLMRRWVWANRGHSGCAILYLGILAVRSVARADQVSGKAHSHDKQGSSFSCSHSPVRVAGLLGMARHIAQAPLQQIPPVQANPACHASQPFRMAATGGSPTNYSLSPVRSCDTIRVPGWTATRRTPVAAHSLSQRAAQSTPHASRVP